MLVGLPEAKLMQFLHLGHGYLEGGHHIHAIVFPKLAFPVFRHPMTTVVFIIGNIGILASKKSKTVAGIINITLTLSPFIRNTAEIRIETVMHMHSVTAEW